MLSTIISNWSKNVIPAFIPLTPFFMSSIQNMDIQVWSVGQKMLIFFQKKTFPINITGPGFASVRTYLSCTSGYVKFSVLGGTIAGLVPCRRPRSVYAAKKTKPHW